LQRQILLNQEISVDVPGHLGVFGSNSLWLWLDRGALRIGTILAGLVLVRYLGPSNYGIYATAIATGAIANIVTDLGLTRYGARTAAAWPQEIPRILAGSLLITAIFFVLEVIAFCVSLALGQTYAAALTAGLILTNFEGTSSLCAALLTGALRSRAILPASILSVCGTIAITLLAVWQHFSVLTLLSAMAFKSIIILGVRLLPMREWWPASRLFRFDEVVATVHRAWPYFSYALAEIAYSQMPVLCLSLVADRVQVGLFAAAIIIANIFPQWLFAASDALLPIITKFYESGESSRTSIMMQRVTDLFVMITVPIAIALSTLAPVICSLMGQQFTSSAPILRIAAFNCILTAIGTLLGSVYLTAANRIRERRNVFGAGVLATVVLILVLGRIYGGAGAAVAVLAGNLVIDAAYVFLSRDAGLDIAIRPILSACLIGGAAVLVELTARQFMQNSILLTAIALLTYAAGIILISRHTLGAAWGTFLECIHQRSEA